MGEVGAKVTTRGRLRHLAIFAARTVVEEESLIMAGWWIAWKLRKSG